MGDPSACFGEDWIHSRAHLFPHEEWEGSTTQDSGFDVDEDEDEDEYELPTPAFEFPDVLDVDVASNMAALHAKKKFPEGRNLYSKEDTERIKAIIAEQKEKRDAERDKNKEPKKRNKKEYLTELKEAVAAMKRLRSQNPVNITNEPLVQKVKDVIVGHRLGMNFDCQNEVIKLIVAGVPAILEALGITNDKKDEEYVQICAILRMVLERVGKKNTTKDGYLFDPATRLGHFIARDAKGQYSSKHITRDK